MDTVQQWALILLPFVAALAGSGGLTWLAFRKFKVDLRKEQQATEASTKQGEQSNVLSWVQQTYDANAKLRDELMAYAEQLKKDITIKANEADLAWQRGRACEGLRAQQILEIASLKVEAQNIRCDFLEFKKFCETNHGSRISIPMMS